MKALTIWQPWASLLVSGQKKYETRSWATAYRGPIAIHAAMRPVRRTIDALAADREGSGWDVLEPLDSLFLRPGALDQLPTGAIVGKAQMLERACFAPETTRMWTRSSPMNPVCL